MAGEDAAKEAALRILARGPRTEREVADRLLLVAVFPAHSRQTLPADRLAEDITVLARRLGGEHVELVGPAAVVDGPQV